MNNKIHAKSLTFVIVYGCLVSFDAWCNPETGDQLYIQKYCEQTYGSIYYEQDVDREKAIKECIDEQSQYYSSDDAPKQESE